MRELTILEKFDYIAKTVFDNYDSRTLGDEGQRFFMDDFVLFRIVDTGLRKVPFVISDSDVLYLRGEYENKVTRDDYNQNRVLIEKMYKDLIENPEILL